MKVLVCGSRDWTDIDAIHERLDTLADEHDRDVLVIHGCARGADEIADHAALMLGLDSDRYAADWSRGKRGGPERNLRMLDAEPDLVLAFQRNGSRGTQHTIDEARKRGIPVEVFTA